MKYQFKRKFSGGAQVTIIIDTPSKDDCDPNGDWYCPWKISGLSGLKEGKAWGVDALQAFQLALTQVAAKLYTSEYYTSGSITWLGQYDLGLPVSQTISDDVDELISQNESRRS